MKLPPVDMFSAFYRWTAEHAQRRGTVVIQPLPGIGDMVWHIPHIHNIARASNEGCVTLLTKRRSSADRLFAADPHVKSILWLDRNPGRHDGLRGMLRLARDIRAGRFAEAWILHGSARYGLATLLAGIPRRIGYGRVWQGFFLSHPVRLPKAERHGHPIAMADRLIALTGIPRLETEPGLIVSGPAKENVARRFGQLPRPWIALGIGSSEPDRQWGKDNFAELGANILRDHGGTLYLIGGEPERDLADWIYDRISGRAYPPQVVIERPIDEVAALLEGCSVFVGNDTGVCNMAVAVKVPSVILFNGRYPPLDYSSLISSLVSSAPALGMQGIGGAAVLARVSSVLSAR
ncbi:MAG: glycosyltransferase family 9 protein [Gammaproteobacteria bacterium]